MILSKTKLKKKHSFFGKKGTTFIVDTRNLHRGKTIKKSNCHRHVLQLYFTNSLFGNRIINKQLDKKWESMYDQVRDSTWPPAGKCQDFNKLPRSIRHELKHNHTFDLVYISDDLETLHIDDMYN